MIKTVSVSSEGTFYDTSSILARSTFDKNYANICRANSLKGEERLGCNKKKEDKKLSSQ